MTLDTPDGILVSGRQLHISTLLHHPAHIIHKVTDIYVQEQLGHIVVHGHLVIIVVDDKESEEFIHLTIVVHIILLVTHAPQVAPLRIGVDLYFVVKTLLGLLSP